MREKATHLWFGADPAPVAGWLHRPAGKSVRGGVVLCAPFGREQVASYPALRSLAGLLAAAGFAVLRFDYQGTGDSADSLAGSDELDSWVSSVRSAVALLRDAGLPWLGAVGLRLGANIAARAGAGTLDSLVLWDPCWEGRTYLRNQELLYRLTFGAMSAGKEACHDAGAVEIPGVSLSAATTTRLRALDLARELDAWPRERALCVITREDDPSRSAHAGLFEPLSNVDQYRVSGQEAMLERPPLTAEVPGPTLDLIASYLDSVAPPTRLVFRTSRRPSATVGHTISAQPITERAVKVGSDLLFGLLTAPVGQKAVGVVVFCNPAAEHHVGPSRQWVELARRWAAVGVKTLRFDGAGTGDSPVVDHPRVAGEASRFYADAAVQDVVKAIRFAAPEEPGRVVVIGLCSGAWLAAMAARRSGARGAVLVNQVVWDEEGRAEPLASGPGGPERPPFGDRAVAGSRRNNPLPLLRSLHSRGVDTAVLLGSVEHQGFLEATDSVELADLTSGGTMPRGGKLTVLLLEQLDHTLLTRPARRMIADQLTSIVLEHFGIAEPAPGRGPGSG